MSVNGSLAYCDDVTGFVLVTGADGGAEAERAGGARPEGGGGEEAQGGAGGQERRV